MGRYISNILFQLAELVPFLDLIQILCRLLACPRPLSLQTVHCDAHTPMTNPSFTSPGSFLCPALRCHNCLAFVSVAVSIAWNGIRLALRIVSMREVAVMMWEEPAVRDV